MVKPEIIRRRLERMADYLAILERLQHYDLESFQADPEHYGSAERFLQLVIESTLDIGSHIIAEENLGSVEHGRDIPRRLREHGHINNEQEKQWIRMIGFRNILVHEYLEVDRTIVHDILLHRLSDIAELKQVFARFL